MPSLVGRGVMDGNEGSYEQSYDGRKASLPERVEARQPVGLTAAKLLQDSRLPIERSEQRRVLGFPGV